MKSTYNVSGMTCSACSRAVERAMSKLDGVTEYNVNLITGKLTLEYDSEKLDKERIFAAVEKAGYVPSEDVLEREAYIDVEGMT